MPGSAESRGRRQMHISEVDDAWLVIVIRPNDDDPRPTARFINTYKAPASMLPEDPEILPKLADDLRTLADEIEQRGWAEAFNR